MIDSSAQHWLITLLNAVVVLLFWIYALSLAKQKKQHSSKLVPTLSPGETPNSVAGKGLDEQVATARERMDKLNALSISIRPRRDLRKSTYQGTIGSSGIPSFFTLISLADASASGSHVRRASPSTQNCQIHMIV